VERTSSTHSPLAYRTPSEFVQQWKAASFLAVTNRAADQAGQCRSEAEPVRVALMRLIPGPNNAFQDNKTEKM
jgi:hypothetical protein